MLCHESLASMFKTNFTMMHTYGYSLTELENMIPWEREIYMSLLLKQIEEENERLKQTRMG